MSRDSDGVAGALAELERAAELAPRSVAIGNDVAAANLILGDVRGDPRLRLHALAVLRKTLELDPGFVPALANRAIALQALSLRQWAAGAWRDAAAREPDGPWQAEIRRRTAELEAPSPRARWRAEKARLVAPGALGPAEAATAVQTFPSAVRLLVEDDLLPAWGKARRSGEVARAAELLERVGNLTEALAATSGDPMLASSVALLREANARDAQALAVAHAEYGRARELHQRSAFAEAHPLFAHSARLLRELGSPFASWAELYLAVGAYQQGDYRGALAALRRLPHDGAVGAYAEWMIGLIRSRQSRFEEALEHSARARRWFRRAGEVENVAQMDLQMATSEYQLGQTQRAWGKFDAALKARREMVTSRRDQTLLSLVGRYLLRENRADDALLFLREFEDEALRSSDPIERSLARTRLASGLIAAGRLEEAEDVVEAAVAEADGIGDPSARQDVLADLAVVEAELFAKTDRSRSLAALERAEAFARQSEASLNLIQIFGLRARLLASDDPDGAARAFDEAFDELQRRRGLLRDPSRKLSYLERTRETVSAAVAFELDRHRPDRAFERQEAMRALLLHDSLRRRGLTTATRSLGEIRRSLASGTGLLVYFLLPDRLVTFVIGNDVARFHAHPVERDEIEARVRRWVRSLAAGSRGEDTEAAAALGRWLVPPEAARFRRLVVIPDGILYAVPFAALPVGSSSARLVDLAPISIDPGANAYLDLTARPAAGPADEPLFLVAGIRHSKLFFPQLASTRRAGSRLERALRDGGHRLVSLGGEEATAERFVQRFPEFPVVVFLGHGISAVSPSDTAGLVLAPSGEDDDGFVSVDDVESIPGPVRTRLAILASCGSGTGPVASGEGPLSVARPFFEIGVDSVLATQWEVEDELTERFIADLLSAAERPTAATLREVQRRWAERGEPTSSWSAFQWLGRSE